MAFQRLGGTWSVPILFDSASTTTGRVGSRLLIFHARALSNAFWVGLSANSLAEQRPAVVGQAFQVNDLMA